jgi:uncharacterized protein (TIGR02996 family)
VTVEADLLAQIADDPASDGPRLALADFYAERGDLRGELMSIQLARHPLGRHKGRLATLLRSQGPRMVGSLVDILDPKSLRFERGRLASCRTVFQHGDQRVAARGNPFWATVTELVTDDAELAADEAMRSLRTVRGLRMGAFAGLCQISRELAIDTIDLDWGNLTIGTTEDRSAIAQTQALPKLRYLEIALAGPDTITAQRLHWILATPLGQQLDELVIRTKSPIDKASFIEFRRSWPRPLRLDFGDWRFNKPADQ